MVSIMSTSPSESREPSSGESERYSASAGAGGRIENVIFGGSEKYVVAVDFTPTISIAPAFTQHISRVPLDERSVPS